MKFLEVEIPVPWGIIAGKSWSDESNPLVIAFHGFQDNANSFDRLIPLLPKSFHYISLDLPCHGKSSHFTTKALPSAFDFILSIKLVLDYYNRKKYILLGHSFGGQLITFFAQTYPEYCQKIICLDSYYLWPVPANLVIRNFRDVITRYHKLHDLSTDTAPSYTLDEAVQRVMDARIVPISEDSARAVISRSLIPVGDDKYKISTSQQLKYHIRFPFSSEFHIEILNEHPITCQFLLIGASNKTSKRFRTFVLPILEEFKKNPFYKLMIVEGSHDVHIDHPERVAPIISEFLLKINSKL